MTPEGKARPAGADCLAGGEMGERMRAFDWSGSPLRAPERWPQSLKTAVRIMLTSRQPIWIGWGRDLTFLYNDPYKSIVGGKHPRALGQPTSVVWREIWDDIGPMLSKAMTGDEGTYVEAQLLIMERHGYPEETYYTFSYSPIPDDDGAAGGIICANTEDTRRVIGERQVALLREVAASTADARTWRDACERSARALGTNPRDLPFALIYLAEPNGRTLSLAGASGVERGHALAAESVDLNVPLSWPFRQVLESHDARTVSDLERVFGADLPTGAWRKAPHQAVALPIAASGGTGRSGVLIAGLNPFRLFDDDYRGFLTLVAGQIAAGVANAEAYEQERKRAEALAELDRAKTAFFSNVSHEFRTPLTLMLGPVEDLLARSYTELSPAAKGQLEVVSRNGQRLLRLVNSLLDFSRIEAGRVRAVYQPTDLSAFTADLASVFRAAVERAGLRLSVDCEELSEPAFVDREMWEKVVLNLLSNAFKFTFEGEIEVTLRRAGNSAELRVRDTGTGIPREEMPRLFERFHRVENARGRTHEGSGIGLALVQELVKLHGGTIAAESVVGQGTTFTVTVPLGSAHLPADRIGEGRSPASTSATASPYVDEALAWLPGELQGEPAAPSGLSAHRESLSAMPLPPEREENRPRVLVADDNADMRQYVTRLLAEEYQVEAVPDGEAALQAARARPPDLVLTDVMMPRLDGFGLLRELRADPRTRELPVIMLSARAGEESRVEGLDAGADDYLVKPFSARELLARVGAQLQLSRLRSESEAAVRASEGRLRLFIENAPAAIAMFDREMRYLAASRRWMADYGLTGDVVGRSHYDVFPEVPEQWKAAHQRGLAGEVLRSEGDRFERADSTVQWVKWEVRPWRTSSGEVGGIMIAAEEITARKEAEEALRESEHRFRTLFESMDEGYCVIEVLFDEADRPTDYRFLEVNPAFEKQTGIKNAAGRLMREIAPDHEQHWFDIYGRIAVTGETLRFENPAAALGRWYDVCAFRVGPAEFRHVGIVFNDITERKQSADALRQSEERLRTVTEAAKVGLVIVDPSHRYLFANRAYAEVLGLPQEDIVGRRVADVLAPVYEGQIRPRLDRAFAGERVTYELVIPPRGAAGERVVAVAYEPQTNGSRVRSVVVAVVDITERKRSEQALRDADRRKDEFLAMLAHELRNPLAPLRNALQILRLRAEDAQSVEQVREMMDRQVTHLTRLVDELLDVSRIARGKVSLKTERLDLARLVRVVAEDHRARFQSAGLALELDVPEPPVWVAGDATRLTQTLDNLLGNAVKFTPRGGRVSIRLSVNEESKRAVLIVRDTGIGIEPEMLPRLFETFSQADRSLDRSRGGLGLGLSLVKGLVELHGGSIEARSEGPGRGAEFTVWLPKEEELPALTKAPAPPPRVPPAKRLRVLIVEDNRDAADSLRMLLQMFGYEVTVAYSGPEGLAAAKSGQPDVVVCDIGLPGMDGYAIASALRKNGRMARARLIAVTGYGQDDDKRRALEAGFDEHLVKPVDPEKLLGKLS